MREAKSAHVMTKGGAPRREPTPPLPPRSALTRTTGVASPAMAALGGARLCNRTIGVASPATGAPGCAQLCNGTASTQILADRRPAAPRQTSRGVDARMWIGVSARSSAFVPERPVPPIPRRRPPVPRIPEHARRIGARRRRRRRARGAARRAGVLPAARRAPRSHCSPPRPERTRARTHARATARATNVCASAAVRREGYDLARRAAAAQPGHGGA